MSEEAVQQASPTHPSHPIDPQDNPEEVHPSSTLNGNTNGLSSIDHPSQTLPNDHADLNPAPDGELDPASDLQLQQQQQHQQEMMAQQEQEQLVIGSAHLRPVFLGNLAFDVRAEDIEDIFLRPVLDIGRGIPVERVDLKRGFGFVFLEAAKSQEDKDRIERYVREISGMEIVRVSKALRAEFARGDGRIKRKEDDRRKKILPNETLFVVNFHEETTKKEDLEMLFSPHGQLVRIDMRKNYAFVQFTNVEDATKAKEATNGGKLDQSVITVEYVAQRERRPYEREGIRRLGERERDREERGWRRREERWRREEGGDRGRRLEDEEYIRRREARERYEDYRGGRGRSPLRERYEDYRRGHSRSRSPIYRYRSRSRSPRRSERDYDYVRRSGGGYDDYSRTRTSGGHDHSPRGGGSSGAAGSSARSPYGRREWGESPPRSGVGREEDLARVGRVGDERVAMVRRGPWP